MPTKTATAPMTEAEIANLLMGKKAKAAAEITAPAVEKKIATRAGWTGTLQFGLVSFGVRMYTATEQSKLSFNGLHAACGQKMNQLMHCFPCEEKAAAYARLTDEEKAAKTLAGEMPFVYNAQDKISGYEYAKGEFVTVMAAELEACEPASDKMMVISDFVPAKQVDAIYFEKTYFLAPEDAKKDAGAAKTFGLLRAGMVQTDRVGIVTFSTRGRQNSAVLRPATIDGVKGLLLHYMFYENEVRGFDGWNSVPTEFEAEEVELASQLIGMYSSDFDSKKYFDTYDVNVRKLVASKIESKDAPVVKKAEPVVAGGSLLDQLRASLAAAKTATK